MHMRRTLGISLAFLVISAGAMAKTAEKSASHHPGQPQGAKQHKAEQRAVHRQVALNRGGHTRTPTRYAARHTISSQYRHAVPHPVADARGEPPDPYLAPAQGQGGRQFGKAAWYNFVGGHTSTGERLDAVTPTAAHRTLPLLSYAKVTNLDSGRSVIVKINDRGPWIRRFIIDLSPRAADEVGMKRAGVASVMVEPISAETAGARATVAAFRSSGTPVTQ
jgi:rare lipoprotein A (peptidoglycan hydrolase)